LTGGYNKDYDGTHQEKYKCKISLKSLKMPGIKVLPPPAAMFNNNMHLTLPDIAY
jgi:hypothetical protein